MKYADENGNAVYVNTVDKGHGERWIIKAVSGQVLKGRDGEKLKSRTFKTYNGAENYLKKYGYTNTLY